MSAHHFNDFFFFQTKLKFNGFKWGAVFPGHLNDAVEVGSGK